MRAGSNRSSREAATHATGEHSSFHEDYAILHRRDGGLRGCASPQPVANRSGSHRAWCRRNTFPSLREAQKNDDRNPEAIPEAAARLTMRFVELKSEYQLDMQTLRRARDRLSARERR
jgi:hypothetical protein